MLRRGWIIAFQSTEQALGPENKAEDLLQKRQDKLICLVPLQDKQISKGQTGLPRASA